MLKCRGVSQNDLSINQLKDQSMSLELAINELTAAVKLLTTVMSTVAEDGGSTLAAGDTSAEATGGKRTRRTKAQIEADNAAAAAAAGTTQAAGQAPAVQTNNTGVVQYVIIDKHNTAAAIQPGEVVPSIEGMRVVTQAEYEAYKAQKAAAASAPAATVQAAATVPSFQDLTNRLVAIHGKGGNEAVMVVLSHFKAASVPALAQADQAALTAKIQEVEVKLGLAQPAAAAAANLFG